MPGAAPAASGFLAYSFPTYQGSGVKHDVPEAETPLILRTLRAAAATHAATANVVEGAQDAVVAAACPVRGGSGLYVWMLTRARPPLGRHGELLATGLAAVLAVILAIAAALAVALRRWKRNLARIESGLGPDGREHHLPYVGEPDLDRVIDAFNERARRATCCNSRPTNCARASRRPNASACWGSLPRRSRTRFAIRWARCG